MNQMVPVTGERAAALSDDCAETLVTLYLGKQLFGLPVLQVRDILSPERVFGVPLAPREVAGSINLRGRIVTVIDMRARLGLPATAWKTGDERLCVTVEYRGELYGLLVDRIGDVLDLPLRDREETPSTLDPLWRGYSEGVFRLDRALLVFLAVDRFLDIAA